MADAQALVANLHGRLLRVLGSRTGQHFQGLQQTSRHLRLAGRISNDTAKKLCHLDVCYNLGRHITAVSSAVFLQLVVSQVDVDMASVVDGDDDVIVVADDRVSLSSASHSEVAYGDDAKHCSSPHVASAATHVVPQQSVVYGAPMRQQPVFNMMDSNNDGVIRQFYLAPVATSAGSGAIVRVDGGADTAVQLAADFQSDTDTVNGVAVVDAGVSVGGGVDYFGVGSYVDEASQACLLRIDKFRDVDGDSEADGDRDCSVSSSSVVSDDRFANLGSDDLSRRILSGAAMVVSNRGSDQGLLDYFSQYGLLLMHSRPDANIDIRVALFHFGRTFAKWVLQNLDGIIPPGLDSPFAARYLTAEAYQDWSWPLLFG